LAVSLLSGHGRWNDPNSQIAVEILGIGSGRPISDFASKIIISITELKYAALTQLL